MRVPKLRRFLTIPILALAACGGGGGGDDVPLPTDVGGVRELRLFDPGSLPLAVGAHTPFADDWATHAGSAIVNDDGTMLAELLVNRAGALSALTSSSQVFVGGDRSLATLTPDLVFRNEGWIDEQHAIAFLATRAPGSAPQLTTFVKREDANVDVVGDYYQLAFGLQVADGKAFTMMHEASLDDAGQLTFARGLVNIEAAGASLSLPPVEYAMSGPNFVIADPAMPGAGAASPDGDVIVIGGGDQVGSTPMMRFLVRRSAGATEALLAGKYALGTMLKFLAPLPISGVGEMEFDGVGAGTMRVSFTNGSDVEHLIDVPLTYSVGSDGSVVVILAIENLAIILKGALTPDGRFATLVGVDDNMPPALAVLIRK